MEEIYLINESPYLTKIIKKNCKLENGINIYSTKGFLYNYVVENDTINLIENNVNEIKFLKTLENKQIIIATDKDDAGTIIALEIYNILNKNNDIKILSIPFDELLQKKEITKNEILKLTTEEIDIEKVNSFFYKKRNKVQEKNVLKLKWIKEFKKKH